MVLGSTQPVIEMSTRNLPGRKGRLVRKAEDPTAICDGSLDVSHLCGPPPPDTAVITTNNDDLTDLSFEFLNV
jgi:hypothetical protein